jgi:stalled ribosome alternative rescue factor ArfA
MKQKQPRKARNMVAKAMHECKLFAPKAIPSKKGKGTIYNRKSRNAKEPSGSYYFGLLVRSDIYFGHGVCI